MAPSDRPSLLTAEAIPRVGISQFTSEQCDVIIAGLAAGHSFADIGRQVGHPMYLVQRWAIVNRLHHVRAHASPVERRLVLTLAATGMSLKSLAQVAGRNAQTIRTWVYKASLDTPVGRADLDAAEIRFLLALLSGMTPVKAAATAGVALHLLDPDGVYSTDVNSPVVPVTVSETTSARAAAAGVRPARSASRSTTPEHTAKTTHGSDRGGVRRRPPAVPVAPASTAAKTPKTPSRRRGRHTPAPACAMALPDPVDPAIAVPARAYRPAPPQADKQLHRRFLSDAERDTIAVMRRDGASCAAIGRTLSRPTSTITREIARNSTDTGDYNPFTAARAAARRRIRPKPAKIFTDRQLWAIVSQGLALHWSPEQIAGRIRLDHPERKEWHVCHETIYQTLYVYPKGGLAREVAAALRTGRTLRRGHGNAKRIPRFDAMTMITERPADVEDRAVPGDWEGDLITGTLNKTAIGTLVDRTSRYVALLHLPDDHGAVTVAEKMSAKILSLPQQLRRSVTWDQGAEMAYHRDFTVATGCPVYFCDPHSPWQRGTNENTNGLLRQYYPKSTDLSVHTELELDAVAEELNNRPRKVLGWQTPAEVLAKTIQDSIAG